MIRNATEKLHYVGVYNGTIYDQLTFVRDINYCFIHNQGIYQCVYGQGPLGLGKSSYAIQELEQLLGEYDIDGHLVKPCTDWNILKNYIIYHPLSFSKIVQYLEKEHLRIKALVWDDAGKYLYSKRWQTKQAQEIATWFQTARSHVASIIMTTPSPNLILGDIRKLCMVTTEVKFRTKAFGGFDSLYSADRRLAYSYDHWYLPDLTKIRTHSRAKDKFSVMLDDSIYYPYKIVRDGYNKLDMKEIIQQVVDNSSKDIQDFNDGIDPTQIGR